ncbi:MAG: FIG01125063: hypothetical protein, partial [uncultured Blastococcus sp.]
CPSPRLPPSRPSSSCPCTTCSWPSRRAVRTAAAPSGGTCSACASWRSLRCWPLAAGAGSAAEPSRCTWASRIPSHPPARPIRACSSRAWSTWPPPWRPPATRSPGTTTSPGTTASTPPTRSATGSSSCNRVWSGRA